MFDLIVVGGGVAGSYLASQIKGRNKVLLIERKKEIIPKDSGIVSTRFNLLFGKNGQRFIKNEITRMDCVSPIGKTFSLSSEQPFAYILRREKFEEELRKNAAKKAEIVYANTSGVRFFHDHVSVKTDQGEYHAKLVAGCDGAGSVVRNAMGVEKPKTALGIMVKTKTRLEGNIQVFFNKYYSPDFFSWVIPQNNEYGLMTAIRPGDYANYFVRDMYLPAGKMYAYQIPYTYTKSYANRAVLVGDACGQNKPLTGGGIMFSMIGAGHAARIINDALEMNKTNAQFLSFYEKYWKKELAWEIEKQFMLRMVYRKLTNKEIDDMFVDFGPIFSTLNGFDYDKLSGLWKGFPKMRLVKFILGKLPRMI